MWTPLDGMRDWSIFSNLFFKYSKEILPGLTRFLHHLHIIELGSYNRQTWYLIHALSDNGFKCTVCCKSDIVIFEYTETELYSSFNVLIKYSYLIG